MDTREDPGQYYPGGKVVPHTPVSGGGSVTLDNTVTQNSTNGVKSSGIWSWVKDLFAGRKVNGKKLDADVVLTGADISVDATEGSKKIDEALDGKLDAKNGVATGMLKIVQDDTTSPVKNPLIVFQTDFQNGSGSETDDANISAGYDAESNNLFIVFHGGYNNELESSLTPDDSPVLTSKLLTGEDGKKTTDQIKQSLFSDVANTIDGYEKYTKKAYSVGDVVVHDGKLWKCKTAIAEPGIEWSSAENWEQTSVKSQIQSATTIATTTEAASTTAKKITVGSTSAVIPAVVSPDSSDGFVSDANKDKVPTCWAVGLRLKEMVETVCPIQFTSSSTGYVYDVLVSIIWYEDGPCWDIYRIIVYKNGSLLGTYKTSQFTDDGITYLIRAEDYNVKDLPEFYIENSVETYVTPERRVALTSWSASSLTPAGKQSLFSSDGFKSAIGYSIKSVPTTGDGAGVLTDRAINTTSLSSVTVPDDYTDLVVRATVESSLAVTVPSGVTKYGDSFPADEGEYLVTITKTGTAECYVKTIKLEEVAA